MNSVFIDRSTVGSKYNKRMDEFSNSVLPFCYQFFCIETDIDLTVRFMKTPLGNDGSFYRITRKGVTGYYIVVNVFLVRRETLDEALVTFFHEMTHLWQTVHGRLPPNPHSKNSNGRHVDFDAYYADPVEVEAREMSEVMLYSYRRYRNNYRGQVPVHVKANRFAHSTIG